ncbi:MAG: nucleotidyltransferase domain-containing protein, partial [Deltaproteobacteria bacterium]|nr:nucleotidyltransferase domain-containing protein [Deltaproteobacteria bacterium]
SVLGNLLGMHWDHSALRTQDIDIGSTAGMSIALPFMKADVPKTLDGLEMGFLPVPPLNPKHPSTSFMVRGSALRLDVVTPEKDPGNGDPVFLPRLNVAAQPLRFLDFLMADPVKGAVIDGGGVLVHVPQPARFALHKLIVFDERPVTAHAKGMKDLAQAAQLLQVLMDERPGDVLLAWDALRQRGAGWVKRVEHALTTPVHEYQEVFEKAAAFLGLR